MKSKFEQLRALLTQKEWENFLANQYLQESIFDRGTLDEILSSAFCWKYSPQGHDYWEAIRERVRNNDLVSETFKTAPEESPTQSRIHILEELALACQQWADNPTTGNEHRIKETLAELESKS